LHVIGDCTRESRCDNGPEYVSGKFQSWAMQREIRIVHIQPGKPHRHGYAERYKQTVRYDWLNQYLFASLEGKHAS
jgi:putative transposase